MQEVIVHSNGDRSLKWYSTREPIILLVLSTMAVVSFVAVSGLSRLYRARQEAMGEAWFQRAIADRTAGNLARAVSEFQAAQLYSRDNFNFQLNLAQTLAELGRTDEAYFYLLNLREREPDNGTVNLDLARILAQKGEPDQAIRYYNNAIYAVWSGDAEAQRRAARLELVEYLLRGNAKTQAESQLIALAGNLPQDAALLAHVGDLFLQIQDYEHALAEYKDALNIDRRNTAALAGAGRASFELARYKYAERYLQAYLAINSGDAKNAELLKTTRLVLEMDPFRSQASSQRNRAVIAAFNIAGDRLKTCALTSPSESGAGASAAEPTLADQWKELKPRVTEIGLRRNPDLVGTAMDVVFAIEQQSSAKCGEPQGEDLALLLISKMHEGNER